MRIPAADLPRVITPAEAERLGISPSALRHAVRVHGWQRLVRGVYLTSATPAVRDDWVLAGLTIAGPRAAVSGWDAVRLLGMAPRNPPASFVLILDREGSHRTVGRIRIRPTTRPYSSQLLPGEHPTLPYTPLVTPARAIADAALTTGRLAPVRALVASAVQRGVCEPAELFAELSAGPRAGSRWFRVATQDVRDGARSIAEAEAADRLRSARVPPFELNVPVVDRTGRVIAVVDVLWRALRAVLEIDSREFHFSEQDWKATMQRHNVLTACGLAVRHDPPSAVRSPGSAWGVSVRNWLLCRAGELGVPFEGSRDASPTGAHPAPFCVDLPGPRR